MRKAIGKASKLRICGTSSGSIWTSIGEEITAKPKPNIPWIAALTNRSIEINISSTWERSNGYVN